MGEKVGDLGESTQRFGVGVVVVGVGTVGVSVIVESRDGDGDIAATWVLCFFGAVCFFSTIIFSCFFLHFFSF